MDFDAAQPDPARSRAPFRLCNIGHSEPVELLYYIACLEQALGRKAVLNLLPMQPGDVVSTSADVSELARLTGLVPRTSIEDGVRHFVNWYLAWLGVCRT